MITRRTLLKTAGGLVLGGTTTTAYAVGVEPMRTPVVTSYSVRVAGWTAGLRLRIAVLADLHACDPWMSLTRIESIVAATNRLGADLIVLLGDFTTAHRFTRGAIPEQAWADALGRLGAPLGVHAVLGNHDWWSDRAALDRGEGPTRSHTALARAGIRVLENVSLRLAKDGSAFWLAGLGDQIAFPIHHLRGRAREAILRRHGQPADLPQGRRFVGIDDLPGTLAQVTDGAPVILLAHEPDIFPRVPPRVALTLCGHTHGGQVRVFGWSPVVPSRYRDRFAYGHLIEGGRQLIVSGGLGCSIAPVRLGVPPEIVIAEIGP